MKLYSHLRWEIDRSPPGPEVGALFDLDGTLISGFSAFAFWRDRLARGEVTLQDMRESLRGAIGFQRGRVGFSAMLTAMAGMLRGLEEKEFLDTGERLFEEALAALIYPESRALVDAHRERGHTVAIVSAATQYQAEPVARELGIEHLYCSRLEIEDGRFTGGVAETCWADGKALAARQLARDRGLDLSQSYFYTDNFVDLPLLREVGRPRVVNPDRRLERTARARGWPVLRFSSRGRPSPVDLLRTGLSLGVMGTAFWIALPSALLNRDRTQFLNTCISVSGELGAAVAGLNLRVQGEEHLWSARPAVFIFNHQSAIDGVLVAKLLRRDFVAVAKQELRRVPLLGALAGLAGTVFLDRSNSEQAVAALQPAVDALRAGTSLVIAPEGTRSPTPRLGPFKKGAFRVAMEAGVPIVPIVFRNTLDAMPKHALVVRPATIEAVVLPPVSTEGWSLDTLNREIARVRRAYLEVLDQR